MKKKIAKIMFIVLCLLMTGCGNLISKEEYDTVLEQKNQLETEKETLLAQNEQLQNEYDEYKKLMAEYEGLQKAEAEAREIEANKVIEEEKAEQEQKEAEEKAEQEQKEKAGYDTGITYDQLARTPDDYIDEKVKFKGEVIQLMEGDDYIAIRLAVDSDYDKILYCEYDKSIVSSRVLEYDTITIYGVSYGLYTYESTLGSSVTIPCVIIDKIEQ